MNRISLWGAILTCLFFTSPELTAGIVSDVQIAGGYLYEVSTDQTVIYDLTVSPPEQVSVITYPESLSYPDQDLYFAINAVVEKNRLYVHLYHGFIGTWSAWVNIYDLTHPKDNYGNFIESLLGLDSNISGGMLANYELLLFPIVPFGKFIVYRDLVIFSVQPYSGPTSYLHSYDVTKEEMTEYISLFAQNSDCSDGRRGSLLPPIFYLVDNDRVLLSFESKFFTTPLHEYLYEDSICWLQYPNQGPPLSYKGGHMAGPFAKVGNYIVTRWYATTSPSSYLGSGIAIIDFDREGDDVLVEVSDFYCTYLQTHGAGHDDIATDGQKPSTDVQDILVHNGEIYLSSHYTRSIAHTYFYRDWGSEYRCQDYWNFFDIPETGRPYGIAAANGTLYVAGKDKRYDFPLAKPDTELPAGGIYSVKTDGTTFNVSGWASDSEGIKQVTVRLDHAYQFLADGKQGECEPVEETGGHTRPVDPCHTWSVTVSLLDLEPDTYTMKVIAEDMDGDFSVIHEEAVQIPTPNPHRITGAKH